jgi:hypothetical protein
MKHPLESLLTAGGILLLALLSCLLFPRRRWAGAGAEAGSDLSHGRSEPALHHSVLRVVFTAGAIEFFVLRFVWRRWFSLAS